ncbi:MAG: hypothetical protein ACT4QE_21265 [Anaerolineales bacterium]
MIKLGSSWHQNVPARKSLTATDFLNDLHWNLTIHTVNDEYQLWTGDKLLAASDSREEIEAFELGMATALGVLPENVLQAIKKVGAE